MGALVYGSVPLEFEFEDRVLAHLQVVIASKLRRGESFTFVWDDGAAERQRRAVWLHPSIPLYFQFVSAVEPEQLNRRWLESLAASANSGPGLRLLPEPDASPIKGTAKDDALIP